MMRKLQLFGLSFLVAAGAFAFVMLGGPAKSIASDPLHAGLSIEGIDIPGGLSIADHASH